MLSLVAAGLYMLVASASAFAGFVAGSKRQPAWHRRSWWLIASMFVILAASRVTGLEADFTAELRDLVRSSGNYEGRRSVQGLVVSGIAILAASFAFIALYRVSRTMRGRRNYATLIAIACGWVMLALVLLRVSSLHMIDQILYGPLKLNWLADLGSSLVIAGAALFYMKLVKAKP